MATNWVSGLMFELMDNRKWIVHRKCDSMVLFFFRSTIINYMLSIIWEICYRRNQTAWVSGVEHKCVS